MNGGARCAALIKIKLVKRVTYKTTWRFDGIFMGTIHRFSINREDQCWEYTGYVKNQHIYLQCHLMGPYYAHS